MKRNGFEIVTDDPEFFLVRCRHDEFVVERRFPRNVASFKDVLDWVNEYGNVLYTQKLDNVEEIGARYSPNGSRYTRLITGELVVYVIRMATRLGHNKFTIDDLKEACSPWINKQFLTLAMREAVDLNFFISLGNGRYQLARGNTEYGDYPERYKKWDHLR